MKEEIIGYKLKDEKYREAIKAIIKDIDWYKNNFDDNLKRIGCNFNFTNGRSGYDKVFRELNVLDLWFTPVYK